MAVTELAPPPGLDELRDRYRAFMETRLYPVEAELDREDDPSHQVMVGLRAAARDAGLWAPHLPPEAGGTGQGFLVYA